MGYTVPVTVEGLTADLGGSASVTKKQVPSIIRTGETGTTRCFVKGFWCIIKTIH